MGHRMASKKDKKAVSTPIQTKDTFHFGDYLTPNPKPIPLNIQLKPDPLVKIEIKKISKTESNPDQYQEIENKDNGKAKELENDDKNPYLDQDLIKTAKDTFSPLHNKQFVDKHKTNETAKISPTPLNEKVIKQRHEIQALESELNSLKIENKKLKKKSTNNKESRHIAFAPSVHIMDNSENANPSNLPLADKVSTMRSKRHSTPYKQPNPKQLKKVSKDEENHSKSSRADYRVTPVPKKNNKRISFKSKLSRISDIETMEKESLLNGTSESSPDSLGFSNKENIKNDALLTEINESSETPKDIKKLSRFCTPKNIHNKSFDLGQGPISETPSVLQTPDCFVYSSDHNLVSKGMELQTLFLR